MEDYQQDNSNALNDMAQEMERQRIWYEYQFEPRKPRGNKGWIVVAIFALILITMFLVLYL